MVSQVAPGGGGVSRCIHMCRKNILFQKLSRYMFGGFEFIRLKVPQYHVQDMPPLAMILDMAVG